MPALMRLSVRGTVAETSFFCIFMMLEENQEAEPMKLSAKMEGDEGSSPKKKRTCVAPESSD